MKVCQLALKEPAVHPAAPDGGCVEDQPQRLRQVNRLKYF